MHQQIQAPPPWNNELDHLSKSRHSMEAKRAIDTSLPLSKEQNTERKRLKMNENVSNAQSNENVMAHGQGSSANWISFSALNLTSWDSFFLSPPFYKYHLFRHSERKRFSF